MPSQSTQATKSLQQADVIPWWLCFRLLGLDVVAFALMWAWFYSRFLDLVLVSQESVILLIGSLWFYLMCSRLYRAVFKQSGLYQRFYTKSIPFLILLLFCVALSLLWIFCFYVNAMLLQFTMLSLFFLSLSTLPFTKGLMEMKRLFKSLSFAYSCAIPAYYSSISHAPAAMVFSPVILCCALAIYLILLDEEGKTSKNAPYSSFLQALGTLVLLVLSFRFLYIVPAYESFIFYALILTAACLIFLHRMRDYLSQQCLDAIRWPLLGLVPLVSILF